MTERYDTIGIDVVAMSVDDIAAQGAEPLFFLDYLSVGKLVPETVEEIVSGVAEGCRQAGCALIGGEMSEHPDLMEPGEFDLVGFAVGVVERARDPARATCAPATRSSASASPGLRCNGYSLARRALLDRAGSFARRARVGRRATTRSPTSCSIPSVIYAPAMAELRRHVEVHAFAHITGGGIPGNLVRSLPRPLRRRGASRHVGRAADLRRDPDARGTSTTRRWSRCSTSGSACSRSCPPATRSARSTSVRAAGLDAWVVGEIVDGHGRVHIDIDAAARGPLSRVAAGYSNQRAATHVRCSHAGHDT